jgi:murein L,D-transpeptidase YafK
MRKILICTAIALGINNYIGANYIEVHPSRFSLELKNSQNTILQTFPIGLGKNGMGKTQSGDNKTPVGTYKILWKASRFWESDGGYPIIDEKAFCGPGNIFTDDPEIGFDDERLWTDSYGGPEAVVMCLDYPNVSDVLNGYTGCAIEIHATQLGGIGEYSSAGCVRMLPKDARDLYNCVEEGTTVIISEN